MKLLHVVTQKFDTGPPDLDKLYKSNKNQNMGSLQKPILDLHFLGSLKVLVDQRRSCQRRKENNL